MVVVAITAVLATIVIHIYIRGDRRQACSSLVIRRLFLQYLARLVLYGSKNSLLIYRMLLHHVMVHQHQVHFCYQSKYFLTPHYHEEEFSKKLKLLKQRFHEFHRQQQQKFNKVQLVVMQ